MTDKIKREARDRRDDGGPAFPRAGANWTDMHGKPHSCGSSLGMSTRDMFAMGAMAGIIAASVIDDEGALVFHEREVAWRAYEVADAMLEARNA